MSHNHDVIDTDVHYKIDGLTRTIINVNETKRELVQHDHNSERFTFEIPRYVDGHDFSECNAVQVHYENLDISENNKSSDFYIVDDLHVKEDDENAVVLSWLISGNATKYVGTLNFAIRFSCVEADDKVVYSWNTTIFKGITILPGLFNTAEIVKQAFDAIAGLSTKIKGLEIANNALLNNAAASVTDIGNTLVISPVPGTTFGDVWTTVDMPAENILADKEWRNNDNWELKWMGDSWDAYYYFKMPAGNFKLKATMRGHEDMAEWGFYQVSNDGSLEPIVEPNFGFDDGVPFALEGCFWDDYGTQDVCLKIWTINDYPFSHFENLEILVKPEVTSLFGNGNLTLTISNGTETKTYTHDGGGPDEAIAYNWTTGQTLNGDGSVYDDVGVPIEIVPLPGINTLQSDTGATKVTYKAYPGVVIEKLQKEIDDLKAISN